MDATMRSRSKPGEAGKFISALVRYKYLYLMLIPGIVFLFIFCYVPMYGVTIAFKDYYPWTGFFGSEWVGLKHFAKFFNSAQFWNLLKNTLLITTYKLIVGFPAPIILALLLNELKNGSLKRVVQTVSYLPHFISWMVIAGMAYNFFGTDLGILNRILTTVGMEPVSWYARPDLWRSILVITAVWKGVGWGSIIYLAGISGINPELYESAQIDGAGKLRQAWSITLPSLMPIISIVFILNMGSLIREDFQQIFALVGNSTILRETTDVFETYIFRMSMLNGSFSYPAAIGLFQSVIALLMIVGSNYLAKKTENQGIW